MSSYDTFLSLAEYLAIEPDIAQTKQVCAALALLYSDTIGQLASNNIF